LAPEAAIQVQQLSVREWSDAANASYVPPKVIVTLGAEAFRKVLSRGNVPSAVVASMLPRANFERVRKEFPQSVQPSISAAFMDQPFHRMLNLVRLVLPSAKRLGVLWGPDSVALQGRLNDALRSAGMTAAYGDLTEGVQVGLIQSLKGVDLFLALADAEVFSPSNAPHILLTTYRARVPVLGFSPTFAKAGATVSLFSTPAQMGRQTAVLVKTRLAGESNTALQYPVDFHVMVNEQVAYSLGMTLKASDLESALAQQERRQ
jgi:hypothetical protein